VTIATANDIARLNSATHRLQDAILYQAGPAAIRNALEQVRFWAGESIQQIDDAKLQEVHGWPPIENEVKS